MAGDYSTDAFLVHPFPMPGHQLRRLFRHWWTAENGTELEQAAIENRPAARPWDPATLGTNGERLEMWRWLEEVVRWFNHEYAWDISQVIPDCWPEHPHLVHEIAVLADARRRAGLAKNSAPLEEWHRVCVPWFLGRMRDSMKSHCEERHQAWPARARYARHVSQESVNLRNLRTVEDVEAVGFRSGDPWLEGYGGDRINLITGEVENDADKEELEREAEERQRAALG
ncbi:MAG: hypothetical protein AAGC63_17200 [Propionicimonas sp.]